MLRRPDHRSEQAKEWRRWYKTARWRNLRAHQLATEPLCRMCREAGHVTAATICDHVDPHKGDETKFWDGPFQSLCKPHHDSTKQREERTGYQMGSDASGQPIDPRHHWSTE